MRVTARSDLHPWARFISSDQTVLNIYKRQDHQYKASYLIQESIPTAWQAAQEKKKKDKKEQKDLSILHTQVMGLSLLCGGHTCAIANSHDRLLSFLSWNRQRLCGQQQRISANTLGTFTYWSFYFARRIRCSLLRVLVYPAIPLSSINNHLRGIRIEDYLGFQMAPSRRSHL